jgi:hypothetical protein
MTTFRITSDAAPDLELACSAAGRFVLWRRGGEVRLMLDDRHAIAVRRALAFAGIGVMRCDGGLPDPPRLVAAIGTGLAPARLATSDLDVLQVRVVPLGEATARLIRRPTRLWPLGSGRRSRCRALLRGTDALLEVRRSAWCGRSTLAGARRALRPVLFDRSATPPVQRTYASEGALCRWVGG